MQAPDKELLREISVFIAKRLGLDFSEDRWPDLQGKLETAAGELGFDHPGAYARWLTKGELTVRDLETLAGYLTVGETYFFRDSASFEVLERKLLPALVAQRSDGDRRLRLWSAGCCTGEEAFSLAIACVRAIPDIGTWKVSILGTDVNPKFLSKAEAASYTQWSFRAAPPWLREGFFSAVPGGKYLVDQRIRELVRFQYLNLAEDAYPSLHNSSNAMDIIFCRNVLMYFSEEQRRRVVTSLHRCLVEGGYLLVNPVEAAGALFPMFVTENIDGVTLFRHSVPPVPIDASPSPVVAIAAPAATMPEPLRCLAPTPRAPAAAYPRSTPRSEVHGEEALQTARAYADQGRLEEALVLCRNLIAAEPTNRAAHFVSAAICGELDQVDEAIAALGRVLYLDQDFILAHHALGGFYKRLDRHRESKRHFAVAMKLLSVRSRDEIVPESDGMSCGRLLESIRAMAGMP